MSASEIEHQTRRGPTHPSHISIANCVSKRRKHYEMARASRLPPFPQNEIMWTKRRGPCDLCCMDGDDCLMVVEVLYSTGCYSRVYVYATERRNRILCLACGCSARRFDGCRECVMLARCMNAICIYLKNKRTTR